MANVITYGVTLDANGAINGFKRLDSAIDANASKVARWEGLAKRAGIAVGVALGTGAVLALRKVVAESEAAQFAQAQLAAALKSTGGAAGLTASALNAQSAAMQRTTTFSDDAVTAMQSVLLTFTKVGGETFPRATKAIADLATRMGGDLQGAAVQVGKALNDPVQGITALTRVGVSFSEGQKEVIRNLVETNRLAEAQAMILAELETEFGGSAEAARDTLGGALKALGNAWGDLFEVSRESSAGIVSALNAITDSLPGIRNGIANFLTDTITVFREINLWIERSNQKIYEREQKAAQRWADLFAKLAKIPGTQLSDTARDYFQRRADESGQMAAAYADNVREMEGALETFLLGTIGIGKATESALGGVVRTIEGLGDAVRALPALPAPGASSTVLGRSAREFGNIGRGARELPAGMRTGPGLSDAQERARADAEAILRIEQETADERLQIQENFIRGAQGAMAGFFRSVFNDGVASFRDLMGNFRDLLLNTVAELAAKRLMDRIFAGGGKAGGGGLLGFLGGPIGIAAGVFGIGAAIAGRNRARNARDAQWNRPSPWAAAEIDRLRAENAALTTRATEGNQLRQSVGGVLTETSASRIVGNLESIRVGIFRLVALAEAGAMGGPSVTVNNGGGTNTSPGASVAALVDRAMGVTTQRLRLASGAAVIG